MVFVIQNTQNRDTKALQLKLDELIRVNQVARNSLISLEEKSELEVEEIRRACLDGRVERRESAGGLGRRSHLASESHGAGFFRGLVETVVPATANAAAIMNALIGHSFR